MAFDFKKECKEFYLPSKKPQIVTVGPMSFIAVRGEGDPNVEDGAYKQAVGMLYAVAYTVKMSKKGDHRIEGYFDFVVPPLEGFWQQPGVEGFDCARKQDFQWISVIRMPDFVTAADLDWAKGEVARKKGVDCSKVELVTIDEGECVQAMHVGPYDDEPATVALMDAYLAENGYENDFSDTRRHHEIYLSDPRRVAPEKCKTVIRHPVRRA
ncbi:transcriptional regulator [Eggerthellaceae bacterium zg-887]|uniref:GyrI-like domain-containing protein n=1 Tax=Xiamenia xianingshaonis TaxID=2682776 RepID=UPI00140A1BA8|nr:GyrI-like domain-containing protein [Xiamenia xianingshaonis]NHM16934.1 transcriptional regulator [Xiamenia xianingshaonis]